MALEAVVFPQDHLFGCSLKDLCGYDFSNLLLECDVDGWPGLNLVQNGEGDGIGAVAGSGENGEEKVVVTERKKRRRPRSCKNKEEVENQRMTHITVERNRRKLMNEYLAKLRSIMTPAYVQRSDQASIVGGAINFVKELEQLLQTLEAQRRIKLRSGMGEGRSSSTSAYPFTDFFKVPQFSSGSSCITNTTGTSTSCAIETVAKNQSAAADIEVTMIERHANLKVLSKRRPKQLLKMVVGLQNLWFTILHLNITTVDQMVLYSFSLKAEDCCQFTSVDDIAAAVHLLVEGIQEQTVSSSSL